MKKLLVTILATLALTTPVFASTLADIDFEGRSYGQVVYEAWSIDSNLGERSFFIVSNARVEQMEREHRAFRQRVVDHFIPNYHPGRTVDANLIQDGRPVEGYTFASIQSMQHEGLPIGEGLPAGSVFTEWLYAYQGMTSLEMAVFNRINEIRVENNLQPLVHDPLLSVGARYRTAYFQRVLPLSERIYHTSGTFSTGQIGAVTNLGRGRGAILGPTRVSGRTYNEVAIRIVNIWMNSPPHRNAILTPQQTRMGVGISERVRERTNFDDLTFYVFFGAH